MKNILRFGMLMFFALFLMFLSVSDSSLIPGVFWMRLDESYKNQQKIVESYADKKIITFIGSQPLSKFGNLVHFYYWKNTIVYVGANLDVRGYAVFTLDGELIATDHRDLIFDMESHISYEMEEYGRLIPQHHVAFQLTDPEILNADFPMSMQELYDRFGPVISRGSSPNKGTYDYLLSDGRWLRLYQVQPNPTSLYDEPYDPERLMLDIDFVWTPGINSCTRPVYKGQSDDLFQEKMHPVFQPERSWYCDKYNAKYSTGDDPLDWGTGELTLNGQVIRFKLLSSRGGWKYLSFVPLDDSGNLTHWAFQAICNPTQDGFELEILESNGFLPSDSCSFSFKNNFQ